MSRFSICVLVFALVGKTCAELDKHQYFEEAIENNDLEEMAELLDGGYDINHKGTGEQTPLMFAILGGKIAAAEFLLAKGADTSIPEKYGYTPFHATGFQGRHQLVPSLIKYGLDPSAPHSDGFTPLHRACWGPHKRHTRTVVALLDAGVSPLEASAPGDSPLNGKAALEMTTNEATRKVLEEAIVKLGGNHGL